MSRLCILAGCFVAGMGIGPAVATEGFDHLSVILERNIQDKDAEVSFEAVGSEAGLTSLKVLAPDGRSVIDFKAPDSKLGLRRLSFESPEPGDNGSVQADFPAGVYTFSGTSADGKLLAGKTSLSHSLPAPTAFVSPLAEAHNVSPKALQIKWQAIKNLDAYVVVIEDEASGHEVRAKLSGKTTSFRVPDGFLAPNTAYKLAIGSVAKGGNATFIETTFTTAKP